MYRNVVYDLHVEASCTVSDVLIENNWFGYGVTVQAGSDETSSTNNNFRYQWDLKDNPCGPYKDWLVRYNSFSGPYGIHWALGAGSPTFSNVRVYANIGAGCKSYGSVGLTYKWVAGSETCGEGATLLPEFSVYAASSPTLTSPIDFHLSGSVASDNKVTDTATDFVVSTDIDGDAVTGATRDVGSDQR
jgi:hypothetical protein